MSDVIEARAPNRGARLMRSVALLVALAALLSESQRPADPHPLGLSWSDWRLPIGFGMAVGLALWLAWPSQGPAARATAADNLAAILGFASTILGLGAAMLIAICISVDASESRIAAHAFIYQMTSPVVVLYFLLMAAPAAISGGLALAVAGRRRTTAARLSAAWLAVRLSWIGIGCAGLMVAASASLAISRWLMVFA